jgi:DNA-directed RNA polymerase subunit M/transcription elongation factor TFIIS
MGTDWLKPENRIRATPLDLLRQGLEEQNWEAVSVCYLMLTGEKIGRSVEASPVELEPELETETEEITPEEETETEDDVDEISGVRSINTGGSNVIRTRTSKVGGNFKNTFQPNLTEESADIKFNPPKEVIEKRLKTRHKRAPTKDVEIQCSKCGKSELVDPILARRKIDKNYTMPYKCNTCSCLPS